MDTTTDKKELEILIEMLMCMKYGWIQHPSYKITYETCAICWNNMFRDYVLETKCGHCYHRECIIEAILHKYKACPECNTAFEKVSEEEKTTATVAGPNINKNKISIIKYKPFRGSSSDGESSFYNNYWC